MKRKRKTGKVVLRLPGRLLLFYARVAEMAQCDLDTVVNVALSMGLVWAKDARKR